MMRLIRVVGLLGVTAAATAAGTAIAADVVPAVAVPDPMTTFLAHLIAQGPSTGLLAVCVYKLWQRNSKLEDRVFRMALQLTGQDAETLAERINSGTHRRADIMGQDGGGKG